MNDRIVTAYRETADQALDYADPDRAVATVRRRRRIRVALMVPVVAAVLGAGMLLRPAPAPAPPPVAAISVADPVVLATPARPEPLPAGATGTAALAYTPCFSGCDALVALTDGRQFVVPPDPAGVFAGTLSLSPGGAWLGYPVSDEYRVRRLTGTTVHRVPASGPGHRIGAAAWSADATKLLLAHEPRSGGDAVYQVLDVTTGATTRPPVPAGHRAFGVLPDGSVLSRPSAPTPTLLLSATGGRTYPIAVGGELRTGESVQSVQVARNGTDVWIVVGTSHADVPTADGKPTAVLLAALTGAVRARHDVPAAGLSEPLGPAADGFVLSHRAEPGKPPVTLVTVSPAGSRRGLTIPGAEGGPVVRLPG